MPYKRVQDKHTKLMEFDPPLHWNFLAKLLAARLAADVIFYVVHYMYELHINPFVFYRCFTSYLKARICLQLFLLHLSNCFIWLKLGYTPHFFTKCCTRGIMSILTQAWRQTFIFPFQICCWKASFHCFSPSSSSNYYPIALCQDEKFIS